MDILTILLLATVVWVGLAYNMAWLSVISGLLIAAYVWGVRNEPPMPVASGMPKIRPIIVKRRYSGPPSIYPSRMRIRVAPRWNTYQWWENAFGAAGVGAGLLAQAFKPKGRGKVGGH
ncbi:MAG: hypothetical protein KAW41_04390 [Candidatus Diapherotrites archaeon]|nr:hypothetical protein [Candidatus Diapherotrites archaeon]